MATVTELLTLIDAKYPNATSQADKIKFMNIAQEGLSGEFGLIATDETLVTAAYEEQYSLPTGIDDISMIETFDISNEVPDLDKLVTSTNMIVGAYTLADQIDLPCKISFKHTSVGATDTLGTIVVVGISGDETVTETVTPVADSTVYSTKYYSEITSLTSAGWVINAGNDTIKVGVKSSRYNTQRYPIGFSDDKPFVSKCVYQVYSSAGVKSIIVYPAPTLSGLPIIIRYKKKLTELSATKLSAEPEFDSRYHDMLATYACYEICANGASPDTTQANRFAAEYDARISQIWKASTTEKIVAPRKPRCNKGWINRR